MPSSFRSRLLVRGSLRATLPSVIIFHSATNKSIVLALKVHIASYGFTYFLFNVTLLHIVCAMNKSHIKE